MEGESQGCDDDRRITVLGDLVLYCMDLNFPVVFSVVLVGTGRRRHCGLKSNIYTVYNTTVFMIYFWKSNYSTVVRVMGGVKFIFSYECKECKKRCALFTLTVNKPERT